MLYDPKWEIGTLADLIAWLRTKPADEKYAYEDPRECLLAQYYMARGYRVIVGSPTLILGPSHRLPWCFNMIAQDHPRTYGGAIARAEAVDG
jgi:hypothetical protein